MSSKVSTEWDALCTVLLNSRDKFGLTADPAAGESINLTKLLENGYVR